MLSDQRTLQAPSPGWWRTLAVLAAGCMTFTACGSGNAQSAAEVSGSTPASSGQDGLEYGDTLADWAEAGGAESLEPEPAPESQTTVDPYTASYTQLVWEDLVPPGYSGDEIAARYQDRLAALDDGSPEADAIYEEMQAEYDGSVHVNDELDGADVYLAGFVAPVSYDGAIITEFLLVPYFGACIHVPPPPPNQTVLVTLDKADGLTFEDSWGPVWVVGTLAVDSATTDLATASYTLTGVGSGVYDEY